MNALPKLNQLINGASSCKTAVELALSAVRKARLSANDSNNPSINAALARAERNLLEARGESEAHHRRLIRKGERQESANV